MMGHYRHHSKDTARAVSRFFAVRGLVRTTLARGKKLDPSAWLRIETLKFIVDRREARVTDVAEYLSITAPSASSLIAGLATDGLIRRRPDSRDRRAALLSLTPKGKRALGVTIARGTRLLGEMFAPLSPAELREFTRTLERILDAAAE
ncbi:MAG TPA: MarR family winged helix-turn-helix transcriptional regulator [Candidatus Paceibacterota bacterium]|nr:MarR family winged helix-turn-helix transcriptional regulator [Candidatus Paceibacterota bacterium]